MTDTEDSIKRAMIVAMTKECDRIKATFPGYEPTALYDPSDARTVWDTACDRLRATLCQLDPKL